MYFETFVMFIVKFNHKACKYNEINFTTYILGIDELDSLNSFIVHCKLLNIPLNNKIHIYIKLEKNDN